MFAYKIMTFSDGIVHNLTICQALSLIRQLGLRPRRTLRLVMWTAEEVGGVGAQAYYDKHKVRPTKRGTFRITVTDFKFEAKRPEQTE